MKIYTKTGDDGTTGLFGAGRVAKNSLRIEAYGTVDELNSVIGILASISEQTLTPVGRTLSPPDSDDGLRVRPTGELESSNYFKEFLQDIQISLFVLGADLATPLESKTTYNIPRIEESDVKKLEALIDSEESHLPPLEKFVLPGGSLLAGYFHLARTVCRRAEREVVALSQSEELGAFDIQYLNRLSDLFFVLSRRANQLAGITDVEWSGKKS